jgi:aminoglycoside phosphotransferase (APT) family kinase protein
VSTPKRRAAVPVDTARLVRRAEAVLRREFSSARLSDLVQFSGGASSLTYLARVENAPLGHVVVKVAPPGLEPIRNRDILRQARVLVALQSVEGVLVPRVYGTDEGAPVAIPPLLVMQYVPGESYEPRHDESTRAPEDAAVCRRAGAAARMLARMHRASLDDLGLGDEPAVSLGEELERWQRAAASCALDSRRTELSQSLCDALRTRIPEPMGPVLLHGDWRLGNMQCAGDRILAVIDWEIWSVGDPRIDLSWLQTMADPSHPAARFPDAVTLSPGALALEYAREYGTEVPALDWFGALARYKFAATNMLLVKNAARRGDTGERWARMDRNIPRVLYSGLTLLKGN